MQQGKKEAAGGRAWLGGAGAAPLWDIQAPLGRQRQGAEGSAQQVMSLRVLAFTTSRSNGENFLRHLHF